MIYMAVTDDDLELTCFVAGSGRELAKKFGVQETYLWQMMQRNKSYRKLGIRFLRVEEQEWNNDKF